MTNKWRTTLYIGVSNSLERRASEHKKKTNSKSFTATYNLNRLVYFEGYGEITEAIYREKQLKSWKRSWKHDLITSMNPGWKDLASDWDTGDPESSSG